MSNDERKTIRKPGRPVENRSFTGKCDVRLSAEENNMLDILAERNNVSRSDIVRRALKDFFRFNNDEE